ncbi:MAG: cell wall-binding repeat-containing protein [Microbacterium sp.]|uniref:cell wall-binding repeat-containing protein n=1 Tax=Microbacterium sp. TaxID=51671 RepID=UPI001AD59406|nr:cell wall-binding repeat-containing protein [Microbacterium sp.]MBN9154220.1 cell wall-binding repeat-containing protein [Microbacterium sp.]
MSARHIALTTVVALGIGVLGASAAHAAPVAAAPSTHIAAAALSSTEAQVSATIQYQPSSGPAQTLSPDSEVTVEFWKLDPDTGYYDLVEDSRTWTGPVGDVWTSPVLEAGTYTIRFQADAKSIGVEWWQDKRYFAESDDIVLTGATVTPLNTVTLHPHTFDVGRVAGADRFGTAVEVSQSIYPSGSPDVVYLANGMNYPDALAAGPAAIKHGGVLLTTGATSLPAATAAELTRLAPARIVVAGGTGAVSDAVLAAAKKAAQKGNAGVVVTRLGGASRYETGEKIVRDAFTAGGQSVAIVATGRNYPDALAAGPAAGYMGGPVILTDGNSSTLPAATKKLLTDLGVTLVIIAGGTGAVSTGIENGLKSAFGADHVVRFAGASRYDTAAEINANTFPATDFSLLASGANFPDALAGAPLAGSLGAPLFLTDPRCITQGAASGITDQRSNGVLLLGGQGALSTDVEQLLICG